jgi:hypothetical protein
VMPIKLAAVAVLIGVHLPLDGVTLA